MIKILALFLIISGDIYGMQPKLNEARQLLAYLRGGDYAHAGDQEAIDLVILKVIEHSPESLKGPCLDVGSGFGGTANYLQQKYNTSIVGIDLDGAAIKYAREHYPSIPFIEKNALQIDALFDSNYFSMITLFNVFYAIEEKAALLTKLAQVAQPGAILAIFDYTAVDPAFKLNDLAGKPMHPINITSLKNDLKETGWEVIETIDLSTHYLTWYQTLLQKLEFERQQLSLNFSETEIVKVEKTFRTIESWLTSSLMGGVIIYAQRIT